MLLNFGKANLIDKALQQPDKVRQTLQKAKNDGIAPTINAVLEQAGSSAAWIFERRSRFGGWGRGIRG